MAIILPNSRGFTATEVKPLLRFVAIHVLYQEMESWD